MFHPSKRSTNTGRIVIFANWGLLAGASRTTWAFARDRGLPGSDYLAYVNPRSQLPVRSIVLCVIIQLLLGLINIGSTVRSETPCSQDL